MLFTGKGDNGTTNFFDSWERVSKNSVRPEALGSLDELNAWLGVCKVKEESLRYVCPDCHRDATQGDNKEKTYATILHEIQEKLFIIQAEVAGAEKSIPAEVIAGTEDTIHAIEAALPPITSFLIAGHSDLSASLDYARTLARRTERRVIAYHEKSGKLSQTSLQYLNRLSSYLYALERYLNHQGGHGEIPPSY